jgi:nucleotide-binding universal stress UspA family protein
MKKIIVPIDFTPASQNASEYAMSLAKVLAAEVRLLHVYTEPMPVGNVPEPAMIATSVREETESRLEHEIDRLKSGYGPDVSGSLAIGFRGDAINETVKETDAGLVVMGMKESHKNKLFGSTTLKMIRKSPKPVLIVPEDARFRPLKNIVLAVDFSEMVSSAGFEMLFTLARNFDSSVRVLHVESKDAEMKASETAEKLQLGRVLSQLTYYYDSVESNDADQGILDFVNSHPTDLLVMIAHPHSLFERLFNTVHTTAISSAIKIPLLVLKAQQLYQ